MLYISFFLHLNFKLTRELMILSRFWDNFVSMEGKKEGGRKNFNLKKCERKLIAIKKSCNGPSGRIKTIVLPVFHAFPCCPFCESQSRHKE